MPKAAQNINAPEFRNQPFAAATFDAGGPVGALHQELNSRLSAVAGNLAEWNHYSRPLARKPMIENVKSALAISAGVGIGGLAIVMMVI